MKKLFKLALVGTMVLAAAACQREQLATTEAPEETGVKEVATQFVLNVAAAPSTKMSADIVQQNNNFRGIENAKLFCYKTGTASGTPYVLSTAAPAAGNVKEFDLTSLMSANQISNAGTDNAENSSNRILNLSIPVGVDAVMMYGKAIKAANLSDAEAGCTYDYNFRDPDKKNTISSTPSKTQFYAHPILDESNTTSYNATGDLMIAVINDILSTKVEDATNISVGPIGHKVNYASLPELYWSELGHQYEIDKRGSDSRYENSSANISNNVIFGEPLEGLEEILGKCYYLFTYIKPSNVPYEIGSQAWKDYILEHFGDDNYMDMAPFGEYRAGSSFAVKKMIIDMYKIIKAASESIPTTEREGNATRLAEMILARAEQFFSTSDGTYKSTSVIKQTLGAAWVAAYDNAADLNDYPGYFGVPEGAAQLGFNAQGDEDGNGGTYPKDAFYYYHPNHPLVNPTMSVFEPRKYLYPAELWYYVNSPIRTTADDATMADFPNGVNPWKTENWTDASWNTSHLTWLSPGKVTSATRAVAVTNSVNYGVALLKSVIKTSVSTLKDNRAALTEETTDNSINVAGSQIKLTGVLVGGVNPRMNWQFTRFYTDSSTPETNDLYFFDGVIFDHKTDNPVLPTGSNEVVNYTLVYDNYNSSDGGGIAAQNDVFLALQFQNDGIPFWGRDNMIPTGGTFYLVGKLAKPTQAQSDGLTWPTDHQIPPLYGINGVDDYTGVTGDPKPGDSKKIGRVFIQDFVTTANITIGVDALKKAYYSVPDLRASQMSLGLSIDLKWATGLQYDINF